MGKNVRASVALRDSKGWVMAEVKMYRKKSISEALGRWASALAVLMLLAGCASESAPPPVAPQNFAYRIGPGDALKVFVWQNSDLSTNVTVRPDGNISLPLIHDLPAAGRTPTQLAKAIESRLTKYVKDPVVTVMVDSFVGEFSEEVRVVGEAVKPQAIAYRKGMTALDAMIAVGGLTQYAAGDRAKLVRTEGRRSVTYGLRLDKLLKDGDISADAPLRPGDVIIIPQTYF